MTNPTPPSNAPGMVPPNSTAKASGSAPEPPPVPANQLTPEEQMAAFEQELKETDWGHQPC